MGSRLSSTPVGGSGGIGTVTSVGLSSAGGLHSVSGTPVTTSGTLALALATQTANTILAGPTSGGAAAPTMRALDPLDIPALDAAKITSGTFADARLASGITGSKISGALPSATLATSALTGTIAAGQLAVSAPTSGQLGGLTTSNLSATAALVAGQIASINPSALTGSGTVPLAGLSGITTTQLSASAGILGSQLDAAAAIGSGQITSLAASKLTGTNTLPDGVLSTNVPLLNAGNTFTAAQTISASLAGVLAQITNSSTTGAGLVIGSTTVASAGAGIIAPALALTQTVPATTRYGLLSVGGGIWDGSTTGKYVGHASGSLYAGNAASGFAGNLLDLQIAGVSKTKVDSAGQVTAVAVIAVGALSNIAGVQPGGASTVGFQIRGQASQTADLIQAQNSSGNVEFGVTNRGSGGSPIWALKVRAVANSESMAQAHVIGAATGKAIEVMDDAGASLGWLALYA